MLEAESLADIENYITEYKNGDLTAIRPPMENEHPDALVVNHAGDVWRYSVNEDDEIDKSLVFRIEKYDTDKLGDVYVFDDYALAFVNGNTFEVIYFDEFRGDTVPDNYATELFSEGIQIT